jgi:Ion channel
MVVGTLFYNLHEKLSLVNSFYLSGVTLATVGYGDVHPVTDVGEDFYGVLYLRRGGGDRGASVASGVTLGRRPGRWRGDACRPQLGQTRPGGPDGGRRCLGWSSLDSA